MTELRILPLLLLLLFPCFHLSLAYRTQKLHQRVLEDAPFKADCSSPQVFTSFVSVEVAAQEDLDADRVGTIFIESYNDIMSSQFCDVHFRELTALLSARIDTNIPARFNVQTIILEVEGTCIEDCPTQLFSFDSDGEEWRLSTEGSGKGKKKRKEKGKGKGKGKRNDDDGTSTCECETLNEPIEALVRLEVLSALQDAALDEMLFPNEPTLLDLPTVTNVSDIVAVPCSSEINEFTTTALVDYLAFEELTEDSPDVPVLLSGFGDVYNELTLEFCDPLFRAVELVEATVVNRRLSMEETQIAIQKPGQQIFVNETRSLASINITRNFTRPLFQTLVTYIIRGRCRGCQTDTELFDDGVEARRLEQIPPMGALDDECFCAVMSIADRAPTELTFLVQYDEWVTDASEDGILQDVVGVTGVEEIDELVLSAADAGSTEMPSLEPSLAPSAGPSSLPSTSPSIAASFAPSKMPSLGPSLVPTTIPTTTRSSLPTLVPSPSPSALLSASPSALPSANPSVSPSTIPSTPPSSSPTEVPTAAPSRACGGPCHSNAQCILELQSCVCDTGYEGDGIVCEEINECLDSTCDEGPGGLCNDKVGGYSCDCKNGYEGNGNIQGGCVDIDECALGLDNCAAIGMQCQNFGGGYLCV